MAETGNNDLSTSTTVTTFPLPAHFRRRLGRNVFLLLGLAFILSVVSAWAVYQNREAIMASVGADLSILQEGDYEYFTQQGPGTVAFWGVKTLYQGIIPYLIVGLSIFSVVYMIGLVLFRVIPWFDIQGDIRRVLHLIEAAPPSSLKSLTALPSDFQLRPGGRLFGRLLMLDKIYLLSHDRETVRNANDRLSATDEAAVSYCLQPLAYAEFMLPVLGFIGTVWGVTEAVDGLRQGINVLFQAKELTEPVRLEFMKGFRGLIFAFDTTLFGLISLAVVSSAFYLLRMRAHSVILAMDKWANEAINLLVQENPLIEGLFVTDEQGNVLRDEEDEKPVLRWQKWFSEMREGFLMTDKEGELVRSDDEKPILRWQKWMEDVQAGFFVTNENGELSRDGNQHPVLRLQQLLNELRAGFLVTNEDGELVQGDDEKPILRAQKWMDLLLTEFFWIDAEDNAISKSAAWRHRMLTTLIKEIYEITSEEADAIAEGFIEGDDETTVLLRSRMERRHREINSQLKVLSYLLHNLAQPVDSTIGADESAYTQHLVVDTSGAHIDTLALDDRRFVIASPDPEGFGEFMLLPGVLESELGGRFPILQDSLQTSQRVDGISLNKDRIAYSSQLIKQIAIRGWEAAEFPTSVVLESGRIPPNAIALLRYRDILHVLFAVEHDSHTSLFAYPADGSTDEPIDIVQIQGDVTAFASDDRYGLALATSHDEGAQLLILSGDGSQPLEQSLPEYQIRSLAFAPNGTLFFGDYKGQVGSLDLQRGQIQIHSSLQGLPSIDFLMVTAAQQVIAAERDCQALILVDCHDPSQSHTVDFANPITALAGSPDGQNLLLAFSDGSVVHWHIRGQIRSSVSSS